MTDDQVTRSVPAAEFSVAGHGDVTVVHSTWGSATPQLVQAVGEPRESVDRPAALSVVRSD